MLVAPPSSMRTSLGFFVKNDLFRLGTQRVLVEAEGHLEMNEKI